MSEQTIRAFIAAMLPPDVRESLVDMGRGLARAAGYGERTLRWVRPEGLHLTFHFEGALPEGLVPEVGRAMGKAASGHTAFQLRVEGIGAFPDGRHPRVIWAGVEGNREELASLARSVEREMKAIGLKPDKPFKPHLTLARVRQGASGSELEAISRALQTQEGSRPAKADFMVEELTLVHSRLDPGGSIYTPLGTARLRGARE
jgi:2'-5' RNA ligase